jgi:hypothetical protein
MRFDNAVRDIVPGFRDQPGLSAHGNDVRSSNASVVHKAGRASPEPALDRRGFRGFGRDQGIGVRLG